MRLGLLDFCTLRPRQSPAERIFETIQLAQQAESLGYSRYWLAEHHEIDYAHHSPELLTALVAGSTERIRVGPAGVLLLLHSPLQVAKQVRLLQAFFSSRLDLGVGAGLAAPEVATALRGSPLPQHSGEEYSQRVKELLDMLRGQSPLRFNPLDVYPPPVWLLGVGGPGSAAMAAHHGTSFGLSLCHKHSRDEPAPVLRYREEFRPSPQHPQPQWIVAVAGVCAETDQEAQRLASSSPEMPRNGLEIVGSPQHWLARLEELRSRYGTEEFIVLDCSPTHESRLRSLRLLSEHLRL